MNFIFFLAALFLSKIETSDRTFLGLDKIPVEISVLKDSTGQWTIDSMLTEKRQQQFDKMPLENAYFGYTTSPHWFRIKLLEDLSHDEVIVVVNFPGIYEVVLYDGYPGAPKEVYRAGRRYPIDTWPVKARNIVFRARHFDENNVLYMKAQEEASLITPIRVMTEDQYEYWKLVQQSLYGVFFGLVIAMILYNLMLFFSLRDITYFYYIIAMAAGGFVALIRSGYAIVYLWPENAQLDGQIYFICGGVSIMASSRFASHFLNFPRTNKKLDIYLWCITFLAFVLVVLTFFYSFVELTLYGRFLVLVGVPSYLVIGIIAWVQGYRASRFFILAWVPYIIGLVLIVFKGAGWVSYHPLIDVSAEIGTSLEAILLSLALADRISSYKRARAEAEKRTLKAELEKQALFTKNQQLDYNLKLRERDLHHEKQQLATSTLWLTQKNKILQEIQKALKSMEAEPDKRTLKEMAKKIAQNLNVDEDWERFKGHFEKVHSGFFTVLQQEFPELTSNEQRLCAYIRMNLSTKEIALLLGISISAVEQARRRMRKKLGISNTDTSLLTFLQNVSEYPENLKTPPPTNSG